MGDNNGEDGTMVLDSISNRGNESNVPSIDPNNTIVNNGNTPGIIDGLENSSDNGNYNVSSENSSGYHVDSEGRGETTNNNFSGSESNDNIYSSNDNYVDDSANKVSIDTIV